MDVFLDDRVLEWKYCDVGLHEAEKAMDNVAKSSGIVNGIWR